MITDQDSISFISDRKLKQSRITKNDQVTILPACCHAIFYHPHKQNDAADTFSRILCSGPNSKRFPE